MAELRSKNVARCRESVARCPRSATGIIPTRNGKLSTGVGRRQPVIVRKHLFIGASTSLVCALLPHVAAQYSAGAYTTTNAVVLKVCVVAYLLPRYCRPDVAVMPSELELSLVGSQGGFDM